MIEKEDDDMQRSEQKKQMKARIIQYAIDEFNEQGYISASMNNICTAANISKGIIYHYFDDKDDLYLACIETCYQDMICYYDTHKGTYLKDANIMEYMKLRMMFFKEFPQYYGLFFYALLRTPKRLQPKVEALRYNIQKMNTELYTSYLKNLKLRESVTLERAVLYLDIVQDAYNDYFRKEIEKGSDMDTMIKKHENLLPEWIDFMIHGLAREDN